MQTHSRQQLICHGLNAGLFALALLQRTLLQQALVSGLLGWRQPRLNALHHLALMPPAAGKSVQHQHIAHHALKALGRLLPALQVLQCLRLRGVTAHLVEQDDDRLVEPGQNVHLGAPISGISRVFGGVDEVEHHIGMVARGQQRALAQVKRLVAPAVPDIAQKPAQRVALLAQALIQAHRITKARRIPQPQLIALRRFLQQIALRLRGDMGGVFNLAHIVGHQCARQRGLANIGVRQQTPLNAVVAALQLCAFTHHQTPAAGTSVAFRPALRTKSSQSCSRSCTRAGAPVLRALKSAAHNHTSVCAPQRSNTCASKAP